jgi:hypothetical protein
LATQKISQKGEADMKSTMVLAAVFIAMGLVSVGYSAEPPEANARNIYKTLLSQADTNKDGKLSVAECMAIYKNKTMAQKNCNFWDADKDGIITEDEYVKQGQLLRSKKR